MKNNDYIGSIFEGLGEIGEFDLAKTLIQQLGGFHPEYVIGLTNGAARSGNQQVIEFVKQRRKQLPENLTAKAIEFGRYDFFDLVWLCFIIFGWLSPCGVGQVELTLFGAPV